MSHQQCQCVPLDDVIMVWSWLGSHQRSPATILSSGCCLLVYNHAHNVLARVPSAHILPFFSTLVSTPGRFFAFVLPSGNTLLHGSRPCLGACSVPSHTMTCVHCCCSPGLDAPGRVRYGQGKGEWRVCRCLEHTWRAWHHRRFVAPLRAIVGTMNEVVPFGQRTMVVAGAHTMELYAAEERGVVTCSGWRTAYQCVSGCTYSFVAQVRP